MKVSIIIPTYNEKENILRLIKLISRQKDKLGYQIEVVVVDDNSPDGTADAVKLAFNLPWLRIVKRKQNRGLGKSIRQGIKASSGDTIIGMDGDLNHDPQILPELISKIQKNDLVIASRFIRGGGMEEKGRYFGTLLFNLILRFLLGFSSTDNLSGYYCIKKSKLKKLNIDKIYYGYGDYHLRLLFFAKRLGYKIVETPVYYKKRKYGESKSNLFKMFFIYLKEAVRLRILYDK